MPPSTASSSAVFGNTLPLRGRIGVTNGAGADGRPFTIPTSLISTVLGITTPAFLSAVALGYVGSAVNLAYLINAGSAYDKLATRRSLFWSTR